MKLLICTLFICSLAKGQDLTYSGKKLPDVSIIMSTHWRQLGGGPMATTIVNPDSLSTKVLNINRAGTYKYELSITFLRNGVSTTVRDTVNVLCNPPVNDDVLVIQSFPTSKSLQLVSRIQSIARIQILNGTKIVQNYNYTVFAGVRTVFITGICSTCALKVMMNNKVYNFL